MSGAAQPKPPSLKRALVLSGLLFVVDGLWLNQGLYSLAFAVILLAVALPRTFLPRFRPVRRERLRNIAVYLAAVAVVWAFNLANQSIARSRAQDLVDAVTAYQAKHKRYPRSLQELVPEYLAEVPRAKYTLAFGEFQYFWGEDDPRLMYTALPPFGRPVYVFSRGTWAYLD